MSTFEYKSTKPARLADTDPPKLPAGAVIDPTDHTLARAAWENGMTVTHPGADDAARSDTFNVQYAIGHNPDPETADWETYPFHKDKPVVPGQPLVFTIDGKDLVKDGAFSLRILYIPRLGDNWYSPSTPFTVDSTPPDMGNRPQALEVSNDQVTEAALDAGVPVTVPAYPDWAAKDRIYLYWGDYSDNPSFGPLDDFEVTANNMTFTLPAEPIKRGASGRYLLGYRLTDKAGNISQLSYDVLLNVALGELADNLKLPRVPAADDGLINVADARAGVAVYIDPFEHAQPGDAIRLYWGGTRLPLQTVASWPFPQPYVVSLDAKLLGAEYGSATGDVNTIVGYELYRGGVLMGTRQDINVTVNLFNPGPTDPGTEWPDPVHLKLPLPVVKGAVSSADNVIRPEDAGQPATLKVSVHQELVAGQVLKFYWGSTYLSGLDHVVDAAELGTEISVQVPWAVIEGAGNGPVSVYYQVVNQPSGNYWESAPQAVAVSAVLLPAPAIDGLNAKGGFVCSSIWETGAWPGMQGDPAARVRLPNLSRYFAEGDTLTVEWNCANGWGDEFSRNPVKAKAAKALREAWEAMDYEKAAELVEPPEPGELIPECEYKQTITLDAVSLRGMTLKVPYVEYVLPMFRYPDGNGETVGRVGVKYTSGKGDSVEYWVLADIRGPWQGTCDLNNPQP